MKGKMGKVIKEIIPEENREVIILWRITRTRRKINICPKCRSEIEKGERVLEIAFLNKEGKKFAKSRYYHLVCAIEKYPELKKEV